MMLFVQMDSVAGMNGSTKHDLDGWVCLDEESQTWVMYWRRRQGLNEAVGTVSPVHPDIVHNPKRLLKSTTPTYISP